MLALFGTAAKIDQKIRLYRILGASGKQGAEMLGSAMGKKLWEKAFLIRVMVVGISLIALNCQAAGLRERIAKRRLKSLEKFRTEFMNKYQQGYDVSEAAGLFRQAQQAREARDRRKSNRLLKEAFVALENAKKLPADKLEQRQVTISQGTAKSVRLFLSNGAGPDWSHNRDLIAYHFRDKAGNFQIATVKPDGTGIRCLTCQDISGGPRSDRHKGGAHWHPSGKYLMFLAEMDKHALDDKPIGRTSAMPGRSWWTNLWILEVDKSKYYQLTNYDSGFDVKNRRVEGAFYPHFSHDGKKVFWAKLYRGADRSNPLGYNQMLMADFIVDDSGVPSLENIRNITLKEFGKKEGFYEPLGFSPNDEKVLFATNVTEEYPFALDIWRMDLFSGKLEKLTPGNNEWNEHAKYSADGRHILWMSSLGHPFHPLFGLATVATDLFMMDADGANITQLTHFNTPGYPEYSKDRSLVGAHTWSPDRTRILLNRVYIAKDLNTPPRNELWMVELKEQ